MGFWTDRQFKKEVMSEFMRLTRAVQGTQGQRRALDPLQWEYQTVQTSIRKNNWKTYDTQVDEIIKMYNARTDYGNSLTRSTIDIRTAFVGGEGISISDGSKKKTADWIDSFLKANKLLGSAFIDATKLAEQEGKCLIIIKKIGDVPENIQIKTKLVRYNDIKYKIEKDEFGEPVRMTWTDKNGNPQSETAENFEYLHYGEFEGNINESPPPAANIITQLVNYERALYDLRENNHTFGKITPVISGKDPMATNAAVTLINKTDWKIGQALGITGDMKYLTPGTDALESLRGEMSLNIKLIASTMGIPVHWVGWTDLMSNRATADTLSELVETLTKEIRLKWIEFWTCLIQKAMVKSEKFGAEEKDLTGFEVALPQITAEKIKELIEAWFLLAEAGYISRDTFLNMLPGVDPVKEKKLLAKQEKENEAKKPQAARDFEGQLGENEEEETE